MALAIALPGCGGDQPEPKSSCDGRAAGASASSGSGRGQAAMTCRLGIVVLLVLTVAACGGGSSGNEPTERSSPALSRDGKWIAFESNDDAIYVARRGSAALRVTDPGKDTFDHSVDWSPDGSRIVFARTGTETAKLYVVNADGSGIERLTEGDAGFGDVAPSWSPDGGKIAFERLDLPEGSVNTIDADGSNERVLLPNAGQPAWSPDGSKIAFVQGIEDDEGIAVFDLQTKRIRRVARPEREMPSGLDWSPDGTQIAFDSGIYERAEIYVVNLDTSKLRRLTRNRDATDRSPNWTQDGRIIFSSDRAGPSRLYSMNSDGSRVRPVPVEFPADP